MYIYIYQPLLDIFHRRFTKLKRNQPDFFQPRHGALYPTLDKILHQLIIIINILRSTVIQPSPTGSWTNFRGRITILPRCCCGSLPMTPHLSWHGFVGLDSLPPFFAEISNTELGPQCSYLDPFFVWFENLDLSVFGSEDVDALELKECKECMAADM